LRHERLLKPGLEYIFPFDFLSPLVDAIFQMASHATKYTHLGANEPLTEWSLKWLISHAGACGRAKSIPSRNGFVDSKGRVGVETTGSIQRAKQKYIYNAVILHCSLLSIRCLEPVEQDLSGYRDCRE
jgi:hypothetical protein